MSYRLAVVMLRFTAAVATAARRTFATAAILEAVPNTAQIDASNGEARLKDRTAKGETKSVVALKQELAALRGEFAALQRRYRRLEALPPDKWSEEELRLEIVAHALQRIDREFQDRFETRSSLLNIWRTHPKRCDARTERALQRFLDENEQWLPPTLHPQFFSAWQSIFEQHNYFSQKCEQVILIPNPAELKAAVKSCCGEMGDDVCDALLGVISAKSPSNCVDLWYLCC